MSGPYLGCYECGWVIHITRAKGYEFCPKCGSRLGGPHADTRDFDIDQPGVARSLKEIERKRHK